MACFPRFHTLLPAVACLIACGGADSPTGPPAGPCAGVELSLDPSFVEIRQPGVLRLVSVDGCGQSVDPGDVSWSSSNPRIVEVDGGGVVALAAGHSIITATAGDKRAQALVWRKRSGPKSLLALESEPGLGEFYTSLSTDGTVALMGTAPLDCNIGCAVQHIEIWSLADPLHPSLVSRREVPGLVLDVEISPDGNFAAASMWGDDNGFVVFDISDPRLPGDGVFYRDELEAGVLNMSWVEIGNTPYLFVAEDGGSAGGLHVFDMSDPTSGEPVGYYYGGVSFVYDVHVRDGLAFVSHWDFGLVVLDVGNGLVGGSPAQPRLVSHLPLHGETAAATYWPAGGYVFVTEQRFPGEDAPPGSAGQLRVIDVGSLTSPREVAWMAPGNSPPFKLVLDEMRQILFVAWTTLGVRAIDVSGSLEGDLWEAGKEAGAWFAVAADASGAWLEPALANGLIYVSGASRMWVFEFH